MAYSSSACRAKIELYQRIKGQVASARGYVSDSNGNIDIAKEITDRMILNGKTIDKGELAIISAGVSEINGVLDTVDSECNDKIEYWQGELKKAIAAEAAASATAKSNGTYRTRAKLVVDNELSI